MIRGGCLCGGVRFEIARAVGPFELCHCSRCRKASGSAFVAGLGVRTEDFRLVAGRELIAAYEAPILEHPPAYRTAFCTRCGSPASSVGGAAGLEHAVRGAHEDAVEHERMEVHVERHASSAPAETICYCRARRSRPLPHAEGQLCITESRSVVRRLLASRFRPQLDAAHGARAREPRRRARASGPALRATETARPTGICSRTDAVPVMLATSWPHATTAPAPSQPHPASGSGSVSSSSTPFFACSSSRSPSLNGPALPGASTTWGCACPPCSMWPAHSPSCC